MDVGAPADDRARRLFVLRHARADAAREPGGDHARPLSQDGVTSLTTLRRFLVGRAADVGIVWCSSATRTRQTLDGIRDGLGAVTVHIEDELYGADAATWLQRCRSAPATARGVLLVGHNPGMARLLHEVTASGEPAALAALRRGVAPGALAELRVHGGWSALGPRSAHLVELVTPP